MSLAILNHSMTVFTVHSFIFTNELERSYVILFDHIRGRSKSSYSDTS